MCIPATATSAPTSTPKPPTATPEPTNTPEPIDPWATAYARLTAVAGTKTAVARLTPTKTPTPTHTPTITPTPTRTTGIFVPTEVPCPPGFTRQWCEEHTPTPTATTVGDDDSNDGGTGPKPTAVVGPPPPPPNRQLFSATVKFRGKPLNDSSTFWRIFESFPTVVQVVANPHANVNIDEYEFKLKVNPGDTGFYVVHNYDYHCSPTRPGDAETDWNQTHTFFPNLIRCGVGLVSNAGVEVLARRAGTTGTGFRIHQTRNVRQAWHRADGTVAYTADFTSPEGARPTWWVPADYYRTVDQNRGLRAVGRAVSELNSHIGTTFSEDSSSYDVIIKPAWQGVFRTCNSGAIACVNAPRPDLHMPDQKMWIMYPPLNFAVSPPLGGTYIPVWTDSTLKIENDRMTGLYFSITTVIAHEFGHTLGLEHLPRDSDSDGKTHIMSQGTQWKIPSIEPSASDLYGLLSVTRDHH